LADSFWDHVFQILLCVMIFQDIFFKVSFYFEHFLLKNKFLFSRNSYVGPIWIFIFDIDQAHVYRVLVLKLFTESFSIVAIGNQTDTLIPSHSLKVQFRRSLFINSHHRLHRMKAIDTNFPRVGQHDTLIQSSSVSRVELPIVW
jgi:hypothetical protein